IITREDRFDFAEGGERLIACARVRLVIAEVDQGVGFGFEDLRLTRQLYTLLVVLAGAVEVLQLAINPSETVRETRQVEGAAVTPSEFHSFAEGGERLRHLPQVSLSHAQSEEGADPHRPIA